MLVFLWWLLIGLVACQLARMLAPGDQPISWVMMAGLGLAGAIVGGFLSSLAFGTDPRDAEFHTRDLIMPTVGAVLLLGAYVAYQNRRRFD